jgi:hypothetical protein
MKNQTKSLLMRYVDSELHQTTAVECKAQRVDLWQHKFDSLIQAKSELTGKDHYDRLQLLKEHLMLLSESLLNGNDYDQTTFFDIKLIANGVQYTIPLHAALYNALTDYIDVELENE